MPLFSMLGLSPGCLFSAGLQFLKGEGHSSSSLSKLPKHSVGPAECSSPEQRRAAGSGHNPPSCERGAKVPKLLPFKGMCFKSGFLWCVRASPALSPSPCVGQGTCSWEHRRPTCTSVGIVSLATVLQDGPGLAGTQPVSLPCPPQPHPLQSFTA